MGGGSIFAPGAANPRAQFGYKRRAEEARLGYGCISAKVKLLQTKVLVNAQTGQVLVQYSEVPRLIKYSLFSSAVSLRIALPYRPACGRLCGSGTTKFRVHQAPCRP